MKCKKLSIQISQKKREDSLLQGGNNADESSAAKDKKGIDLKIWHVLPPIRGRGVLRPKICPEANSVKSEGLNYAMKEKAELVRRSAYEPSVTDLPLKHKVTAKTLATHATKQIYLSDSSLKSSNKQKADDKFCGGDSNLSARKVICGGYNEHVKVKRLIKPKKVHFLVGTDSKEDERQISFNRNANQCFEDCSTSSELDATRNFMARQIHKTTFENKENSTLETVVTPVSSMRGYTRHPRTVGSPFYPTDILKKKEFRPKTSHANREKVREYLDQIGSAHKILDESTDIHKSITSLRTKHHSMLQPVTEELENNKNKSSRDMNNINRDLKLEDFTESDFEPTNKFASAPRSDQLKKSKKNFRKGRSLKVDPILRHRQPTVYTRPLNLQRWIRDVFLKCFGRKDRAVHRRDD